MSKVFSLTFRNRTVAMYHRLRRGSHVETDQQLSTRQGLDPSLEIHPERPAIVRSREDSDE